MAALAVGGRGYEGRRGFGRDRRRCIEDFAATDKLSGLPAIGQKAEVTDAHEPRGKHVEQEAPDEFPGIEGHGFLAAVVLAVPVEKSHAVVFDRQDSVIGDGDAVGIAAQILQYGFRRREGSFGIDDPLLFPDRGHEFLKLGSLSESGGSAGKAELVFAVSSGEVIEEFCAEDHAQGFDVKQEVRTGPDPPPPVETQRTARDQAVEMEVVPQSLLPSMKDRQESDSAVQMGASEIGK